VVIELKHWIIGNKYTAIDVINVFNVYQKFLINAYVISVNVYCFNKHHIKCRKSFVKELE